MYELSERSIAILAASIVVGTCLSPVVLKIVGVTGDAFYEKFGDEGSRYIGYFVGMFPAGAVVYIVLFFFLKLFLKILRI